MKTFKDIDFSVLSGTEYSLKEVKTLDSESFTIYFGDTFNSLGGIMVFKGNKIEVSKRDDFTCDVYRSCATGMVKDLFDILGITANHTILSDVSTYLSESSSDKIIIEYEFCSKDVLDLHNALGSDIHVSIIEDDKGNFIVSETSYTTESGRLTINNKMKRAFDNLFERNKVVLDYTSKPMWFRVKRKNVEKLCLALKCVKLDSRLTTITEINQRLQSRRLYHQERRVVTKVDHKKALKKTLDKILSSDAFRKFVIDNHLSGKKYITYMYDINSGYKEIDEFDDYIKSAVEEKGTEGDSIEVIASRNTLTLDAFLSDSDKDIKLLRKLLKDRSKKNKIEYKILRVKMPSYFMYLYVVYVNDKCYLVQGLDGSIELLKNL